MTLSGDWGLCWKSWDLKAAACSSGGVCRALMLLVTSSRSGEADARGPAPGDRGEKMSPSCPSPASAMRPFLLKGEQSGDAGCAGDCMDTLLLTLLKAWAARDVLK